MKRMNPIEMLPTLVTLGNLFSGFLAIAYLTDSMHVDPTWTPAQYDAFRIGLYDKAMLWILFAMIFDAVDGKIARMTGSASDFGAQIDSLSDVISFGAAPALLFKVMVEAHPGVITPKTATVLAVVYLACAALRLARFNVETDLSEEAHLSFKGLPSPAAAAAVLTLAYVNIQLDPQSAHSWLLRPIPLLVPAIGFLMISRFPYVHVTNRFFRGKKPFRFLAATVFSGALVIWLPEVVIPAAVGAFVFSGPLTWVKRRVMRPKDAPAAAAPAEDEEEII